MTIIDTSLDTTLDNDELKMVIASELADDSEVAEKSIASLLEMQNDGETDT